MTMYRRRRCCDNEAARDCTTSAVSLALFSLLCGFAAGFALGHIF